MISAFAVVWFALLGAVIGSFLNVVIYRMHTGRSLGGRSHCTSCGSQLSWKELIPLFSFLLLRGRCKTCSARISPRYFVVESITAALFAFLALTASDPVLLILHAAFIATMMVVVVYDLRHTIIPDECVVAASGVALLLALYTGYVADDFTTLLLRLIAAAVGFLFFYGLWRVSGGRWVGLGDAKLAIPLGVLVSWPQVVSALVLSFWIGAAVSVALLFLGRALKRGQGGLRFSPHSLTMKSEVPFAPFLVLGFLITHFLAFDAFRFIESLLHV